MNAEKTNAFLDHLIETLNLKNSAALARILETTPSVISKLRHGKLTVGPALQIKVHELTGWSFPYMREQLGGVEEKVAA
jgi:plasmid maintenance system antidote protein VapI